VQPIETLNQTILLAIELSASTWLVAARVPGSDKPHFHRLDAGDTAALLALISSLRDRVARRLGPSIGVVSCFEAGRDGFWLHRLLTARGVVNYVLEPTSILINRRARRAKTDRLDAIGMLRVLAAYLGAIANAAAWCACRRRTRKCQTHAPWARETRSGKAAH
jgi:transposase